MGLRGSPARRERNGLKTDPECRASVECCVRVSKSKTFSKSTKPNLTPFPTPNPLFQPKTKLPLSLNQI